MEFPFLQNPISEKKKKKQSKVSKDERVEQKNIISR